LYTNERILELKQGKETLLDPTAQIVNSTIIQPCYIGPNVVIRDSVIGPHASIEAACVIEGSVISNSIIQRDSVVKNACISKSMLGKSVTYVNRPDELSLGDFSAQL